ncbi:ECF transporter S component [Schaalia sp. Marseille-Q2122]|uniref:ECF transporter S component n=1 Tax=Schaalia sp. Marseille-Q2122 TaxID=2736604 RepID=UPI00158B3DC1|nr:ECF transporter S component [Schaalia sp. Marseille-Q2122]
MVESKTNLSWRVIDIVTAAVLSVATGLIFLFWNQVGFAGVEYLNAIIPGVGGLLYGIWYLGGVLGGLVIRKPGAALFVETLAAVVSMALGSQWGVETVYAGLAQGLGAELIFVIFAYRRYTLLVAILSGILAAAGGAILEFFLYNYAKEFVVQVTVIATSLVSGAILSGVLGWILVRSLAQTGALDRFAAGREVRERV